jgi:DNA-binding transcriptional MerR regulator
MKDLGINRLYYSIGDVNKITGVNKHVIRYWETVFSELKPMKNRAGNRIFTTKDSDIILKIKRMLKEEKYTIEGAKAQLKYYLENKETEANNNDEYRVATIKKVSNKQHNDLFDELDKFAAKVSHKSSIELTKEYKDKLQHIRDLLIQVYNKL